MIRTQSVQSDPKQGPIVESCILTGNWHSRHPTVEFHASSVCLGTTRENLYWQSADFTWAPHPTLKLGACRMNMGQVCQFEHHFESVFQWTVLWYLVQATQFHTWFHQCIFWWVFLNWPSWIWMIYKAKAVKFFLHSRIVKWPPSRLSFLSGGTKHWCS